MKETLQVFACSREKLINRKRYARRQKNRMAKAAEIRQFHGVKALYFAFALQDLLFERLIRAYYVVKMMFTLSTNSLRIRNYESL